MSSRIYDNINKNMRTEIELAQIRAEMERLKARAEELTKESE